jgi:inhibitor of KinA sporulation pathway (predicted exonuclease)
MHYIVFDTEFNQPQPKLFNPNIKFRPNRICPFEIIEIGAVKVNQQLEIVDTFQSFINPVIYKRLSPIVSRKTRITKKDLKKGESFVKVIKAFRKWIGEDYILCTWSNNDIRELKRNCRYHHIDEDWLDNYYDVQLHCTKLLGLPKSHAIGLKNSLQAFEIEEDTGFHRAIEDAIYTAKVFIKVYSTEMEKELLKTKEE